MSQHISTLGDITTITPAQEASIIKANDIVGMGAPMAYEHRGDRVQFIYSDINTDADDIRLILDADGTFDSLQYWDGPDFVEDMNNDDWVDMDGGELCTRLQEALAA